MRSSPFRTVLALALTAAAPLFGCSAVKPFPAPSAAASGPAVGSGGPASPLSGVVPQKRAEHARAKVPVSAADPQWGNVDAPVTVVEFSDFECPFCSRVGATLEELKRRYGPQQLRLVFKHNPLPFHRDARPAAEAAAAVFQLGGSAAFFRFHDRLFENQQRLSAESYEHWALSAGVQPSSLKASLASGRPAAKVEEDMALARAIGANGTPAFRINGLVLSGAQPVDKFVELIDEQLAAAKKLLDAGTPERELYSTLTNANFVEPAPPPEEPREPDVWAVPVTPTDPQRGDADALVTIVIFSEFQCPFCKRVEPTLDELRQTYGKDLRLVWKDNPLPFHPRAMPAALLARQVYETRGNEAFWKMHDAIFESQPELDEEDLRAIASAQGLSWKALGPALRSDRLKARISESMELAADFKARGTPHFFINGRRLSGAQPVASFKTLIDEELVKARALVERGTPRAQVYTELTKGGARPPPPERKQVPLRAGAASRGNVHAPVVIQVFSDFQCPYCKRVEPTLSELSEEFKGQVRLVWRHLPLPMHAHAQLAAEAAEEALAQKGPEGFWAYHDRLFAAQDEEGGLERDNLGRLARAQGLNGERFDAALDGHVHAAKVEADAKAAAAAGVDGTPAFVINDYFVSGAQPAAAFRRIIRAALKEKKAP